MGILWREHNSSHHIILSGVSDGVKLTYTSPQKILIETEKVLVTGLSDWGSKQYAQNRCSGGLADGVDERGDHRYCRSASLPPTAPASPERTEERPGCPLSRH